MFSSPVVIALYYLLSTHAVNPTVPYDEEQCEVQVRIESGWICGLRRHADNGVEYASFQGIPYARQPLGQRRFKELQPAKPWDHHLDTTQEGPICPQHDEIFSRLMASYRGMSEACIYGNVYVPIAALPEHRYEHHHRSDEEMYLKKSGLRILVFVHGGAFQSGSADSDLYGPEYLVGEGIILVTFNYRLNVFGFLSLDTPQIPGNAGLRDMVTFLRWVQRNARSFGGDPHDVTLMGQSSGAATAHLLSLSQVTRGLFKRVILLSGTANPGFYTASPIYAKIVASLFLTQLGINSTDPVYIHDELVRIPLERILKANSEVQYMTGLVSFAPVIETPFPKITRVLDDEPWELVKRGRGSEYSLMIQFATDECEFFRRRLEYLEFTRRIEANPTLILSPRLAFNTLPQVSLDLANKTMRRYFKGKPTLDEYMHNCLDVLFRYPAFKLVEWRSSMKGAPVYLSQFSYESVAAIIKNAIHLRYNGTAHVEDLTYLFKTNSNLGKYDRLPFGDDLMKEWMKMFVVNFMKCRYLKLLWLKIMFKYCVPISGDLSRRIIIIYSDNDCSSNPTCTPEGISLWPAVHEDVLNYQRLHTPGVYSNSGPTSEQADMIRFFDQIEGRARKATLMEGSSESAAFINTTLANLESFKRPPYVLYRYNKHTDNWQGRRDID